MSNSKATSFTRQALTKATLIASIAAIGTALAPSVAMAQSDTRTYRVAVTNITPNNRFTPILGVTHRPTISLFTVGQAPSTELATLAEGGDTTPLASLLNGLTDQVSATQSTAGLLDAGQTVEFEITTSSRVRSFSMAAMILPTNDSFVALNGVRLPAFGTRTYIANGYDAGSEVNDELCANIPGPTCGGDGAFTAVNGEGFVHISSGIHGQGDLQPAAYDWRNPMASVRITRIQ